MRASRVALYVLSIAAGSIGFGCGSSAVTSTTTAPSPARCQLSIANSTGSFGASGGAGTLSVTVSRECAWTAASDVSWIAIAAGASGQGDGSIAYRVSANADPSSRRGAITVGDQRADIGQDAAACEFRVSGPSGALDAAGARAVVDVRAHGGCGWEAHADEAWAAIDPRSGRGDAEVTVTVSPNSATTDRVVGISIADQRVTLRQLGAAAPPQPPAPPVPPPQVPPPPPPPLPPPPQPIELNGKIDGVSGSCPSLQFTLKGYVVKTSAATEFAKGPCKDMKNGRDVRVSGVLADARTVTASRVELDK